MRHLACVAALLVGLTGNGYAFAARPRLPIPIERPIAPDDRHRRTTLTFAWWRR
jgi:hypothetical protein